MIGDIDLHLFNEGTHTRLHDVLGAHSERRDGVAGTRFSVWAPNASRVTVVGDWQRGDNPGVRLEPCGQSGIWEGFAAGAGHGSIYQYRIEGPGGFRGEKADPLGSFHEQAPRQGSIVWDLDYSWGDAGWMGSRGAHNHPDAPISIYEVHLGSWMRVPEQRNRPLTYREIAPKLAAYVRRLGFTHVELMPVMEHPFYGSWGYQVTGYFAPSSCYGTPQDFMFLVDTLHQAGIGVLLDWTPAHFPMDPHGLARFDGTHLYEHADPRQGFHPHWSSAIFNYGRHEVRGFLISSALFWLDRYHVDGLRVDAVASMLYLDYGRGPGEWIPNRFGGRENLDAIDFLRRLNEVVGERHPDVLMVAEESTSWPMVSRPTYAGGLGFGFKWDMGWMHDTLRYLGLDPIYRKYHHREVTFRGLYAFAENFVLPLSHDEVVHGKGSLYTRMHGDRWRKLAQLRLLYAWMWAQPGKKLLFMGGEIAQEREWNHDASLDWHLCDDPAHARIQLLVGELNRLYSSEPTLHLHDREWQGFEWIDANDADSSVLSFLRKAEGREPMLAIFNFTPEPRHNYRVGVGREGFWRERLNTDAVDFGGSGHGNCGRVRATPIPSHGRPFSLNLTLPPLGALFLDRQVD